MLSRILSFPSSSLDPVCRSHLFRSPHPPASFCSAHFGINLLPPFLPYLFSFTEGGDDEIGPLLASLEPLTEEGPLLLFLAHSAPQPISAIGTLVATAALEEEEDRGILLAFLPSSLSCLLLLSLECRLHLR